MNDDKFLDAARKAFGHLMVPVGNQWSYATKHGNRYFEFGHRGLRILIVHERLSTIDAAISIATDDADTWVPVQAVLQCISNSTSRSIESCYAASPQEYAPALMTLAIQVSDALDHIREHPQVFSQLSKVYNQPPEALH